MENEASKRIASYRDLRIYQRSYVLALEVHTPVSSRLLNAGNSVHNCDAPLLSIPINIAEGYGRKRSPEDFKRFLVIALGSSNEVSVVLDLARDLGYLSEAPHTKLKQECEEIGKGINKLIQVWR